MPRSLKNKSFSVIALGGSIIVPHLSDSDGINTVFLKRFRSFILKEVAKGKRFVIVTGGGKITRVYQRGAAQITKLVPEDLDWIGLHATRLNGHLLRTIFRKEAYPWVIDKDPERQLVKKLINSRKKIFVGAGWRPGWSTDYVAAKLAQKFGAKEIVDAGNIAFVYEEDPNHNGKAKPIKELSWKEYRKLIPSKWTPGMPSPFDPVATRLAEKLKLKVKILDGANLTNVKKAIEGKPFEGTLLHP